MAHKTFISYKYSECCVLRDRIIEALGDDASYYKGETSDSPDLTDTSTENIKKHLTNMLFDTSVTIVILSPNMKESKWIDWEIEYSLKRINRKNRTSQTNGIVAVIKKVNGDYSWFKSNSTNYHGTTVSNYNLFKIFDIISENHFNSEPKKVHCEKCESYDYLDGSYITFVEEDEFCKDDNYYIENAYKKSENDGEGYLLRRKR